jgi:hypothetical protein
VDNKALDEEFNSTLVDLQVQGVNMNNIRGGRQGQQRVAEAVAMESASRLLTRRTLERLKAIATGEYKPEPISEEALKAETKPGKAEAAERKEAKASTKGAGKSSKSGASKKTVGKSSAKKSTSRK